MDLTENQVKGYCLMAMEYSEMNHELIRDVMNELRVVLDTVSPERAEKKFVTSSY